MKEIGRLVHLLQDTPVRKLIKALEQEGFLLKRSTHTGAHVYHHPDGRILVVHYHHGSDTLTRKTLKSYLEATGWTEEDLKRLKLI
jgi:predicted RNA binding protein YcfA (HicA-like mRNA interferase family)